MFLTPFRWPGQTCYETFMPYDCTCSETRTSSAGGKVRFFWDFFHSHKRLLFISFMDPLWPVPPLLAQAPENESHFLRRYTLPSQFPTKRREASRGTIDLTDETIRIGNGFSYQLIRQFYDNDRITSQYSKLGTLVSNDTGPTFQWVFQHLGIGPVQGVTLNPMFTQKPSLLLSLRASLSVNEQFPHISLSATSLLVWAAQTNQRNEIVYTGFSLTFPLSSAL